MASQSFARSARMSSSLAPVADRAACGRCHRAWRAGAARPGYVYGYAWVPRAAAAVAPLTRVTSSQGERVPHRRKRKNGCRRRKRDSVLVAYGYTHAYHIAPPLANRLIYDGSRQYTILLLSSFFFVCLY